MSASDDNEYPSPSEAPLSYEPRVPLAKKVPPDLSTRTVLLRLLPIAAYAAHTLAGVGADRVQIPDFKKFLITFGTVVVVIAALKTVAPATTLSGHVYLTLMTVMLGVGIVAMWFWN